MIDAPVHASRAASADSGPHRAVTPAAFVRLMLQSCGRADRDAGPALRSSGISRELLALPDGRITAKQFESLCQQLMQLLDDEALGWFSRPLPWGTAGLLVRGSMSAPDLGIAWLRWCRHHALLTRDVVMRLERRHGRATLSIDECADLGDYREFCLLTLMRTLHGIGCWFVDSRIVVEEVCFPFPAPPHADLYPLLFPGPVHFDAPFCQMRVDERYLALPVVRDESAVRRMLRRALPLTVKAYRRDRLLVGQVRDLLARQPAAMTSAERIADALGMSTRTLHRRLGAEHASLQQLKDEVRLNLATDLLLRTNRSIASIAAAAGFGNDKSFSRAYRDWTGVSPDRMRQRAARDLEGERAQEKIA